MSDLNPNSTEIPIPDPIFEVLDRLPYGARGLRARRVFEDALNKALDSVGWPAGERGNLPIPTTYWYVNIWDKDQCLKGHVGPIHDGEHARRVAKSWRDTGCHAVRGFTAHGPSLTNNYA